MNYSTHKPTSRYSIDLPHRLRADSQQLINVDNLLYTGLLEELGEVHVY